MLYLRHTIETESPVAIASHIMLPDPDMRHPTVDFGEPLRLADLEEKISVGDAGPNTGDVEQVDRVVRPRVAV